MAETREDILQEIKDRFREAYDSDDELFSEMLDDLEFANGNQWPGDLKSEREADVRPCLVINKIPVFADQIIGDIRQNEPSIKIKPVDSKADVETAEILTGLIRNIEVQNDAEVAYDTAAESAVMCGMGAFRIGTDYSDDESFDQEIKIYRIKNPLRIHWDPAAEAWDKSDARFCFITQKVPKDDFKRDYPNVSLLPFDGGKDRNVYWGDDKTVRIVEYYRKYPKKKTRYLLKNSITGETMLSDVGPVNTNWVIERKREVESTIVQHYKAIQSEIIEGPNEWPSKYIPIVMVYGKELNIEGRTIYRGVVRNAKDPQRLYNYSRSAGAEMISLAPKSPYLVTAKQIGNYQGIWDQAHKRNFPYLPYEVDPQNPVGKPYREQPVSANTGIQAETLVADQEMHDTTGLQQSNLGQKSNEQSGRAILARAREGDTANYPFYDNLGRALRYAAKIFVDLIPKIYDTARVVRIINPDGSDKQVPINQPFQEQGPQGAIEKIFDLTVGKYDVVVSVGPSYATQRDEAAENMLNFLKIVPAAGPLIADLVVKNLDWPGAPEIEKRLKALLPPGVLQSQEGQAAPPPPAPPDPSQMMQVRKLAAEVQGKEIDNEGKFYEMQNKRMGMSNEG